MLRSIISIGINVATAVLLFAGLFFLAMELTWLSKTIYGSRLLAISSLLGAVAGFMMGRAWGLKNYHLLSGLASPRERALVFAAGMALCLAMLSGATSILINHKFSADKSMHAVSFVVADKQIVWGKHNMYYAVWIEMADHHVERYFVDENYYEKVVKGQRAYLMMSSGALGFDVIQSWSNPSGNWVGQ